MKKTVYKPKAPCRTCDKRTLGCHDYCRGYQIYKDKLAEFNKIVRLEKYKLYPKGRDFN